MSEEKVERWSEGWPKTMYKEIAEGGIIRKTLPPQGVVLLSDAESALARVEAELVGTQRACAELRTRAEKAKAERDEARGLAMLALHDLKKAQARAEGHGCR